MAITRQQMKRFIKKYLPEYGVYGTAAKFREIHKLNPRLHINRWGAWKNEASKINEEFCNMLNQVSDQCPNGIYDPSYVKEALKGIAS